MWICLSTASSRQYSPPLTGFYIKKRDVSYPGINPILPRWILELCSMIAENGISGTVETGFQSCNWAGIPGMTVNGFQPWFRPSLNIASVRLENRHQSLKRPPWRAEKASSPAGDRPEKITPVPYGTPVWSARFFPPRPSCLPGCRQTAACSNSARRYRAACTERSILRGRLRKL